MKLTFKQRLIASICCYVMVMTACVTGLVIVNRPSAGAETLGWSEWTKVRESPFYTQYVIAGRVVPRDGIVEVSSAACLGAVSYLTHQPTSVTDPDKPARETFNGVTIKFTDNIDLSKDQWTPISSSFRGNIDGNGKRITGMQRFISEREAIPRFHSFNGNQVVFTQNVPKAFIAGTSSNVTIQNLTIEGVIETNPEPSITQATAVANGGIGTLNAFRTTSTTKYKDDNTVPSLLRGKLTGADLLVANPAKIAGAISPNQIDPSSVTNGTTILNPNFSGLPQINSYIVHRADTVAGFVADAAKGTKIHFKNCISRVNVNYWWNPLLNGGRGGLDRIKRKAGVVDTSNAFGFLSLQSVDTSEVVTKNNGDESIATVISQAKSGAFFDSCVNYGNFYMHRPLLGAAGIAATATVVANSANHGTIEAGTGYLGGIVVGSNESDLYIRYCYNNGVISLGYGESAATITTSDSGAAGGIAVGHLKPSASGASIIIRDSSNYGNIQNILPGNTAIAGILAQYNSLAASASLSEGGAIGYLLIQNCLSLGKIDHLADSQSNSNYWAGIVARIIGNGLAKIETVFTEIITSEHGRGGAIIDSISSDSSGTSAGPGSFYKTQINGAIHVGPGEMTQAWYNGSFNDSEQFSNYGEVSKDDGLIDWDKSIAKRAFTLSGANTSYMVDQYNPSNLGIMERLKMDLWGNSTSGGEMWRTWYSPNYSTSLGNWGMYLTMSELDIREYNFETGVYAPYLKENLKRHHFFNHSIIIPGDQGKWTFEGYDTGNGSSKTANFIYRGAGTNEMPPVYTSIMAFGRLTLFEKWTTAQRNITFKFPDVINNPVTWEGEAWYATQVNNSQNDAVLDYEQGTNKYLYRPTLPAQYSNWKFQGWYNSKHFLVTEITYEMLGEITLYGIFRENAKWEIIYDSQNGYWDNGNADGPGNPTTLIMDTHISLNRTIDLDKDFSPICGNWYFEGWYYDTDFTQRATLIHAPTVSSNIYLYANWIDRETGEPRGYKKPIPEVPIGFFGMIMEFLESIFGNATIGLIIIGASLIMLIVLIRLFSGRKKSTGSQSQNATQILTELLIKQQVAAAGANAIPGQAPMGGMGMGMGGPPMQFHNQFAPPPPPPMAFSPSAMPGFGSMPPPPPPPSFDMGEPPPFVDIPRFDSSAFDDPPPPPSPF